MSSSTPLREGQRVIVYSGRCYGRLHHVLRDNGQSAIVRNEHAEAVVALKSDMEIVGEGTR